MVTSEGKKEALRILTYRSDMEIETIKKALKALIYAL